MSRGGIRYTAVGTGHKVLTEQIKLAVTLTLPGLVPAWVLTVLFSAAVYGVVWAERWLLKPKN